MLNFKKPEWLDSALGVVGFILSVLSTIYLLNGKPWFSEEVAVFGSLGLGLMVVAVAFLFRPRHAFDALGKSDLAGVVRRLAEKSQEIIILNPTQSNDLVFEVLRSSVASKVPIAIVGDAALVTSIYSYLSDLVDQHFFDVVRVSGTSADECVLCSICNRRRTLVAIFFMGERAYRFRLTDVALVELIASILKRESGNVGGYIGLGQIAAPRTMISVAHDQQKLYLRNFRSLQSGWISFYGTEVQSVQAGWVESGEFRTIDTLDLTTNPSRLLERQRYNAANRAFIAKGGAIRRVYMVRRADLARKRFREDLARLRTMQHEMGVSLGLVLLDDLRQEYRKDFILYDDAIVLVEDQQASSDYTLGRSTAYFGHEAIAQHRADFDAVWSGKITGVTPAAFLLEQLGPLPIAAGA